MGLRVTCVLERLRATRGLPRSIVLNNGPESPAEHPGSLAYAAKVTLCFIRPGKPIERGYASYCTSLV